MTAKDVKNVYQRFSEACALIGAQPWAKDLVNSQYKSIPIDSMRAGVRSACVKSGLVHIGPIDVEYECHQQPNSNTKNYRGSCKFRYVNIDNPGDAIEFESLGEASDNGDKGIGKLVTNMIKNHYKAAFDIGELGMDDIDAYTNEDIAAEDFRINDVRNKLEKKLQLVENTAEKLTKRLPAEPPKEKEKTRKEMIEFLNGALYLTKEIRERIEFIKKVEYGVEDWVSCDDDQIRKAYNKVMEAI